MNGGYAGDVEKLILEMAKALVDHPDEVEVEAIPEGDTLVLELSVAENDMGRVIGRSGRTAKALRTLLAASATRAGRRCSLEILE
jgi:predicted RNA-binding protein YlqC (UPF0109 family)